jgi:hypothetical protein
MDERRRQDRRLLTFFSRVIDHTNERLLGYLVDMTTEGALIVGNLPLKVNKTFLLRIDLPENYPQKQLDIEAQAIWCSPDEDPELFRTGMKLIRVDDGDQTVLERLIKDYGLIR